jgi:hypothetical protein
MERERDIFFFFDFLLLCQKQIHTITCRRIKGKEWLIIYCFTSRSKIFHLYGDITIAGEGLQNLGLCSALRAFEQEGIFIVTRGIGFSGHIRTTSTFSRVLRHVRGCGGPILTRIPHGMESKITWLSVNACHQQCPRFRTQLFLEWFSTGLYTQITCTYTVSSSK